MPNNNNIIFDFDNEMNIQKHTNCDTERSSLIADKGTKTALKEC